MDLQRRPEPGLRQLDHPLLGFFLLPWTTLAYAAFWDWGSGHQVTGFEWFFVVLAFLIDLGSYTQGRRAQAERY